MRGILTYHSIDSSGSVISIDEQVFARHLLSIETSKVRVTSVREVVETRESALAFTFDDGFVNFSDQAWPLLRERGYPVVLFVATDHVGGSNAWRRPADSEIPEMPLLDWDSLAALAEDGVEIGSHSRSHRDLRKLSDSELEDELFGAADRIQARIGTPPRVFAYPYGAVDDRTARFASRVYDLACTTELRLLGLREEPHLLPRLDAYYFRDTVYLGHWGSLRLRGYLYLRAWARAVRMRLQTG